MLALLSSRPQEEKLASLAKMTEGKKHTTIGVRVDDELLNIVQALAKKDERPVASMARKLMIEALEARKLIKSKKT